MASKTIEIMLAVNTVGIVILSALFGVIVHKFKVSNNELENNLSEISKMRADIDYIQEDILTLNENLSNIQCDHEMDIVKEIPQRRLGLLTPSYTQARFDFNPSVKSSSLRVCKSSANFSTEFGGNFP